ncbi:MAG: ABC transporter permease [Bacteroidetes bacterium]|uniref:ABC transporter permease n=1 Tax=Phnomibacter sp. TaxID=2836217 RepID=UPI002FDCACA0|nr:ABC transporter permease [Bacteroidota bacterium]
MNKTWLIIKREYLTRVSKKTFVLSTFLTPILLAGIIAAVIFMTVKNVQQEKIAVADKNGLLKEFLEPGEQLKFEFLPGADTSLLSKGYSAVLLAPGNGMNSTTERFEIYTRKNLSVITEGSIRRRLNDAIETRMVTQQGGMSKAAYDSIRSQAKEVGFDNKVLDGGSEVKAGNSGVAYAVGYGAGFLIYITLFLYGAMVMRGVMEEKTNRIAEVVVSSVKPKQLMLGKIIGIGAVGVTQFVLWVLLIVGLTSLIGLFVPAEVMEQVNAMNKGVPGAGMAVQANQATMAFAEAKHTLSSVNWWFIVGCFLFYFVFGYLFYAALFAAVGSAVNEDPQDAQSLMMPITMPIIFSIVIMMNAVTRPESALATWASIIPFSSPIVMMARLPFGVPGTVPYWQLALSMVSLVLGFLGTTWLSAKIYRTGILMYGKKVTLKEMWKWAFRKD